MIWKRAAAAILVVATPALAQGPVSPADPATAQDPATPAVAQNAAAPAPAPGMTAPPAAAPTTLASHPDAITFAQLPDPPVTPSDVSDRHYTVIGQVFAGVRKATLFSKSSSETKIYRELWERGKKLGADAVIHASYGEAHVSAMSWGQTNATGIAVKFDAVRP